MPEAYVLITTEIGKQKQVGEALRKISGIQQVHGLWGVYDIIASVKAETLEDLKEIINDQIEKIGKINSKLTMIISEHTGSPKNDFLMFTPVSLIQ